MAVHCHLNNSKTAAIGLEIRMESESGLEAKHLVTCTSNTDVYTLINEFTNCAISHYNVSAYIISFESITLHEDCLLQTLSIPPNCSGKNSFCSFMSITVLILIQIKTRSY